MRGFTLIEVMVALVIVSVAVLALGGFSMSIVNNGQISRERLSAVHLGEQVMEVWQHSAYNFVPAISAACVSSEGTAVLTATVSISCTPASGSTIPFTIQISQLPANGPLPTNLNTQQAFSQQGYTTTPQVKLVSVAWTRKGTTHQIYLTHLSKVQ